MKTENFDKLFRQKLLDLTPGVGSDEAVALHQRLVAGRKRTQRKRGALLLFTLLFISLLALNIGQWFSIRQLQQTNEQLTDHIRSIHLSLKHIEQQQSTLAQNARTEKADQRFANGTKDTGYTGNSSSAGISQEALHNTQPPYTAADKAGYYATRRYENAGEKNIKGENGNDNHATGGTAKATQQPAAGPDKNRADHMPDSSETSLIAKSPDTDNDSIPHMTAKTLSSSIVAGNSADEDEAADPDDIKTERRFKLSGRAGLSMQKANSQIGGGITGDLFIGRHWGLNLGLNYMSIDNDNYSDENDFRRKKGHDFRDYSLPNLSDTVKVTNIDIDYTLLQIPIAINYRIDLPRNFFLLASLGTDIDVYGRKKIAYFAHSGPYSGEQSSQSPNSKIVALNNTVIGMAAEKQWSRFTLQVGPYLSAQLKKTDYKNSSMYYGLRLRCFYNF